MSWLPLGWGNPASGRLSHLLGVARLVDGRARACTRQYGPRGPVLSCHTDHLLRNLGLKYTSRPCSSLPPQLHEYWPGGQGWGLSLPLLPCSSRCVQQVPCRARCGRFDGLSLVGLILRLWGVWGTWVGALNGMWAYRQSPQGHGSLPACLLARLLTTCQLGQACGFL